MLASRSLPSLPPARTDITNLSPLQTRSLRILPDTALQAAHRVTGADVQQETQESLQTEQVHLGIPRRQSDQATSGPQASHAAESLPLQGTGPSERPGGPLRAAPAGHCQQSQPSCRWSQDTVSTCGMFPPAHNQHPSSQSDPDAWASPRPQSYSPLLHLLLRNCKRKQEGPFS